MDNKKLVYNNEQYNILTNINIGTTTFLICIDIFDKKLQYFKQEVINGKIKLTSQANLITTANEVNKKSITNKKRILDAFISKIQEFLVKAVFVDRNKVVELFKKLPNDIDASDLKYYIIDNASIEPTDDSINNLISKYNEVDVSKNLEEVHQMQNELYYYNTKEEVVKEKSVDNANVIASAPSKDEVKNGPVMAKDPFASGPTMAPDPFRGGFKVPERIEPPEVKRAPKETMVTPGIMNPQEVLKPAEVDLSQTQILANVLNENLNNKTPNISSSNSIEALVNKNYKEEEKVVEEPKKVKKTVRKAKDKTKLYVVIIAISLIVAVVGFLILFKDKPKTYSTSEIMKQVLDTTTITDSDKGELFNDIESNKLTNEKLMNVDFNELIETNSDTVGWINFESVNINYPVVQAKTNSYYNNYSYYKTASTDGWIHTDIDTSLNELGNNTIIYGNMTKDNALFSNLKQVLEEKWYKNQSNHLIKLSTINSNTSWQVFSVYETKVEDYYLTYNFKNDEEYLEYLNEMQERSIYEFDVTLNESDKVLTLTTSKDKNTKIVVQAKLIKIEEKDEK